MSTRDRFQKDRVRKLDRIGLLFTRDRSGAGPERIQTFPKLDLLFSCYFAGPVLETFRTGSRTVPCEHLDRFLVAPPAKFSLETSEISWWEIVFRLAFSLLPHSCLGCWEIQIFCRIGRISSNKQCENVFILAFHCIPVLSFGSFVFFVINDNSQTRVISSSVQEKIFLLLCSCFVSSAAF